MKKTTLIIAVLAILLTACSASGSSTPINPTPQASTPNPQPRRTDFQPVTKTPVSSTATPSPTETMTIEPTTTATATATLTATWADIPAGKVVAPILLYHHIANIAQPNRYYLSTDAFDEQMRVLHDWGYTTIPISTLVTALTQGGSLPPRPVVISFDDGNLDIYKNAFPIMQKYGYTGTFYIIAGRLVAKDFVTADELIEMAAAGWEIGSHSMTHIDLTQNHASLAVEVDGSRARLEKTLNVPINTFAYPFGTIDPVVAGRVVNDGFLAAVGLGTSTTHTKATLYYLSREEVRSSYDIKAFEALLPWQGPPG